MKYVYIIVLVVITVLVAFFASQNAGVVTVSLFTWSASGSLSLMLVIALVIGLLIGIFIMLPAVIGGSFRHSITRHKLNSMQKKEKNNTPQTESGSSGSEPKAGNENSKK